ncbi:hypothetical protein NliqN6_6492 [Naganishia liquefaciens]|uniref:BHLH domain-containing protein n=1 Tax=Naganishia liquefaciens TaxID=104408 RepID=A0A8H3U080_9TREE|nr:hypothetical protein NliqN6_6492 [Naganishia liquefaciens]
MALALETLIHDIDREKLSRCLSSTSMYSNSYSAMARLTIDSNTDNELPRIGASSPHWPLPSIKDTLSPPLHHAHSYSHSYSSSTGTSTPSTSVHAPPSHGRSHSQSKPGPSRTGRPHSQSVSSMTSPYSYSTTSTSANGSSANTSFVNLRSSFMQQSPPSRYSDHPSRASLAESLHRHHSASSLPPNAHYHHLHAPIHHSLYQDHDLPTTGPRKRRSSTTSTHAAAAAAAAASASAERRGSGASDRPTMTGIGLASAPPDEPPNHHNNASPRGGSRSSLMMTPNHSGGPGQPIQRRQGFAVPEPAAQTGQMASDPSAVRRLAHLQCEQRRRESINGGFATLRTILPETTNADSKAAILQKAINYIQHLEQSVRASGGKVGTALKAAPNAKRKKKSSLSNSTSEVTSPADDDASLRDSPDSPPPKEVMSPIRDAVEDMAVDMELSDEEHGQHHRDGKEKRGGGGGAGGALYMLGSVASAASRARTPPLPELHYAREPRVPLLNRLGLSRGGKEDVVVNMSQGKDFDDKVPGRVWEHVENTRVYR